MLPNVTKMLPKSVKSVKKSQKFYCECCDYYASRKDLKTFSNTKTFKKASQNVTKTSQEKSKTRTKIAKIFVCEFVIKNIRAEMVYGITKKNVCQNLKIHQLKTKELNKIKEEKYSY